MDVLGSRFRPTEAYFPRRRLRTVPVSPASVTRRAGHAIGLASRGRCSPAWLLQRDNERSLTLQHHQLLLDVDLDQI